jgi:hypothetical protein
MQRGCRWGVVPVCCVCLRVAATGARARARVEEVVAVAIAEGRASRSSSSSSRCWGGSAGAVRAGRGQARANGKIACFCWRSCPGCLRPASHPGADPRLEALLVRRPNATPCCPAASLNLHSILLSYALHLSTVRMSSVAELRSARGADEQLLTARPLPGRCDPWMDRQSRLRCPGGTLISYDLMAGPPPSRRHPIL